MRSAQKTALGSTGRSGGDWGGATAGRAATSTDSGVWKEGAAFSTSDSRSSLAVAMAGMYWYCAVLKDCRMRTTSKAAAT